MAQVDRSNTSTLSHAPQEGAIISPSLTLYSIEVQGLPVQYHKRDLICAVNQSIQFDTFIIICCRSGERYNGYIVPQEKESMCQDLAKLLGFVDSYGYRWP